MPRNFKKGEIMSVLGIVAAITLVITSLVTTISLNKAEKLDLRNFAAEPSPTPAWYPFGVQQTPASCDTLCATKGAGWQCANSCTYSYTNTTLKTRPTVTVQNVALKYSCYVSGQGYIANCAGSNKSFCNEVPSGWSDPVQYNEDCCCQFIAPTPTSTPTPTLTNTPTPSNTPIPTATTSAPTNTPMFTPTSTPTSTHTPTPTNTPTITPTKTPTPTNTPTPAGPTSTPTPLPTLYIAYVSASSTSDHLYCNDPNNPCKTIQGALNDFVIKGSPNLPAVVKVAYVDGTNYTATSASPVINLTERSKITFEGGYNENFKIKSLTQKSILDGANLNRVVNINLYCSAAPINCKNDVTPVIIDNFEIINGQANNGAGILLSLDTYNHVRIINNSIHGNKATSTYGGGIQAGHYSSSSFSCGNSIEGNRIYDNEGVYSGGIHLNDSMIAVKNNFIYNNRIMTAGTFGGSAALIFNTSTLANNASMFSNNTVDGNSGGPAALYVAKSMTYGTILYMKNNIFSNNTSTNDITAAEADTPAYIYNTLFWPTKELGINVTEQTSVVGDPSYNAGDYYLTPNSAAVNVGTSQINGSGCSLLDVSSDINTNPRPQPQGGIYDAGAYELPAEQILSTPNLLNRIVGGIQSLIGVTSPTPTNIPIPTRTSISRPTSTRMPTKSPAPTLTGTLTPTIIPINTLIPIETPPPSVRMRNQERIIIQPTPTPTKAPGWFESFTKSFRRFFRIR